MTPEQFAEVSRIMRRPGPARDAARMVLVDGMRPADAARAAGVSPASASNAVTRARAALKKLQAVEWG